MGESDHRVALAAAMFTLVMLAAVFSFMLLDRSSAVVRDTIERLPALNPTQSLQQPSWLERQQRQQEREAT